MTVKMRGRRKIIPLYFIDLMPTRYERAQTRGCYDLRWAGPNSDVRIIQPAQKAALGVKGG